LETWPDGNRQSRVVFITRNISEAQVRGLIAAVRAIAYDRRPRAGGDQ
jgi:hypothetical protein